jgi:CubicO group peptidase (beta-lactamase class C family)
MRFMAARMPAFAAICVIAGLPLAQSTAHAAEREGAAESDRAMNDGAARSSSLSFDLDHAVALGERMPRLQSLLVSHRGTRVLERYFHGHRPDELANIKSVSKSMISALVGIAIERGYIGSVDVSIDEYFPVQLAETDPSKARITIENLLTMQAGLRSTSNGHYGAWIQNPNWVDAVLGQPLESRPGEAMLYSTGNTHLLSAVLTQATGRDTLEFAREVLAEPLGFKLAAWPRDPQGIYVGGNDMELTPGQMLAFGELYINEGRAGSRQIIPAEWVDASLRPHATSPVGDDRAYGYGWWICTLAGYRAPHAWGYGGQFIVLVPDLDLVIVTTSAWIPDAIANEHANRVYALLQHVIRVVAEGAPSSRG